MNEKFVRRIDTLNTDKQSSAANNKIYETIIGYY